MGHDSLVIANTIELLGGGVASTNLKCPGAIFYLQPGADPGAPQPTTNFVASLLLDGERPFGRRASNRTIKLPVWITAPNRQILAAARELLQQAIDQDFYTITWTRDGTAGNPGNAGLPLVLDCYRALPTVAIFNTIYEKQEGVLGMQVQLTIPALPYGRSATQAQVSFTAPVPTSPTPPPPPSPVVLDAYDTISSTQCFQSTQCVVGPTTCAWDPDLFGDPGGQNTALTYSKTFPAPLNLFNMTSLQFWLGFGSRYYTRLEYVGKCHGLCINFTLTDSNGHTLTFSRSNLILPVSPSAQSPVFSRVTIPIPQTSSVFNYASVASYSVQITNRNDNTVRLSFVTAYLDALTAYPGSQQVSPVVRGSVFTLYGVQGTARAPVSMSFQQAPSALTPTTVTATGAGNYTVPANTVYLKVECWGAGGAGAEMTVSGVGAGGGGGEYAQEPVFAASSGQVVPYTVGAGDTTGGSTYGGFGGNTVFGPAPGGILQVTANGGQTVATNSDVAGAGGTGSKNAVEHPGGPGLANPANTFGGGGGSSAGPSAAGNAPVGSGSVLFTTPGTFSGASGWQAPGGVTRVYVECWGAGGGGGSGGTAGSNGGGGGGGEYAAAWVNVTPGTFYNYVVGAGGTGGTNQGNGSAGFASQFTGDAGFIVLGHAGQGGLGTSWLGNPGSGGNGGNGGLGTNTHPGGLGGPAYPYTGGGGSSAGPGASGNASTGPTGAVAPAGGGNGGNGSGNANGAGANGIQPGGGGGGSHVNTYNGGTGGNGQVKISYPAATGAPTNAAGVAVSGGGAGGAGAASAGNAGANGASPGGGGGGAYSSGTTQAGGNGGNGQITVTPYGSAGFKTLIVHRPPLGTLKTFQPMVSVGGGADVPDGSHQYVLPQPVTGVNADFGGTYTVYLINSSWNGSGTRNITVTVTQYEYAGGPGYSVSTLTVTLTPSQVVNGIVTAGVLTLPVKAVAPDNLGGYYTVSVTDSNVNDRFYDCLFLDTMGQTVVVNEPSQSYITYYIDAPDPNVNLGRIMGSNGGRADAISVLDNATLSGGPLFVEPADADNLLFVYSADANVPNVSLSYFPAYFFDRTQ